MSKRPNTASVERKLDALARSESQIHERLAAIRQDVHALASALDKITAVPPRASPSPSASDIGRVLSLAHFGRHGGKHL
jgi:hypothetical protein